MFKDGVLNVLYFCVAKEVGWWVKIATIEELLEYWENYDSLLQQSIEHIPKTKELASGYEHANDVDLYLNLFAKNRKITYEEAKNSILSDLKTTQFNALKQGCIYINRNQGWKASPVKADQFVHKNELIFPDFKNGRLEIKKFPMGNHFYAYIDGVQIRNGDILKWNTEKEAREYCEKVLQSFN